MSARDVIFALASGAGRAGVAVVRVSGDGADMAFHALTGAPPPPPRRAALRTLRDPCDGSELDRALTLYFRAPASFTGENIVEFHLHGGPAVIAGVTDALAGLPGFRPAEAGEFSRRAFRNGKLDLAEAEGLADLIDADTAMARSRAIWQMQGGLSTIYAGWRASLVEALALAEAGLDFADEPVPDGLDREALLRAAGLQEELAAALRTHPVQERLRDGLRIVLSGAPNVGKSSLLNALARRDAAIVTSTPGATRDVLEVKLELAGYPVSLYDTAGLRETSDAVEAEGVRRARAAAAEADLVVEVRDISERLDRGERAEAGQTDGRRIIFWNKSDLAEPLVGAGLVGSAATGAGLAELERTLTEAAKRAMQGEASAITRARHRAALADALGALERAQVAPAPELAAEDMRTAMRALGRVVGVVDVEDILDQVFGSFCIGK